MRAQELLLISLAMSFHFNGPVHAGRIGDVYEETKVVVRCNDGSVVLNAEGKLSFKVGGKVHTMDVPESGKVAFKLVVAAVDSKGLVINSSQIEPKVEINIETDVESVTLTAGDVTVNGSAVNVKVDAGNVTSAGDVRAAVVEAGSVTAQTINSLRAENITVYADAVGEVKGGVVTVECKQCSECAPSDSGEKKKKKRK